jgi:hypothetical protein
LHGGCDALWIVLHTLEAKIDREVSATRFTGELLNVTVLVVSDTPFDQSLGLAVDTDVNVNWLDDYWLNDNLSQLAAELYGPNVLALDIAVDVVGTRASPNGFFLDNSIDAMT